MNRIILFVLMLSGFCATASVSHSAAQVKVNGMVCGFCAQGLSKKFLSEASVKNIIVDLDSKTVTIDFKDGKTLNNEQIETIITDSGFTMDQIERM